MTLPPDPTTTNETEPVTSDARSTPAAGGPAAAPLPGSPERAASGRPRRTPHPIELESYRILRSRIDTSGLPPLSRAVTERTVHSVADVSFAETLVLDERALEAGRDALLAGAPLIVDTRMAAAGLTARETIVPLADPRAAEVAGRPAAPVRPPPSASPLPTTPTARSGRSATRRRRCSRCWPRSRPAGSAPRW